MFDITSLEAVQEVLDWSINCLHYQIIWANILKKTDVPEHISPVIVGRGESGLNWPTTPVVWVQFKEN